MALYELAQSIRHGDAATLERLVAWEDVREGLKEDVCDEVLDNPADNVVAEPAAANSAAVAEAHAGDGLKPFGFSFVRGVAGNMIDANVTARGVVSAAHQAGVDQTAGAAVAPEPAADDAPRVVWAFFDAPTGFSVWLRPRDRAIGPIHIRLEWRDYRWRVVRAWLPHALLMRANART